MMEEEGFMLTSPNSVSKIMLNENIRQKIKNELCRDQVIEFIQTMRGIGIGFKELIDLVSEAWDQDREDS